MNYFWFVTITILTAVIDPNGQEWSWWSGSRCWSWQSGLISTIGILVKKAIMIEKKLSGSKASPLKLKGHQLWKLFSDFYQWLVVNSSWVLCCIFCIFTKSHPVNCHSMWKRRTVSSIFWEAFCLFLLFFYFQLIFTIVHYWHFFPLNCCSGLK